MATCGTANPPARLPLALARALLYLRRVMRTAAHAPCQYNGCIAIALLSLIAVLATTIFY